MWRTSARLGISGPGWGSLWGFPPGLLTRQLGRSRMRAVGARAAASGRRDGWRSASSEGRLGILGGRLERRCDNNQAGALRGVGGSTADITDPTPNRTDRPSRGAADRHDGGSTSRRAAWLQAHTDECEAGSGGIKLAGGGVGSHRVVVAPPGVGASRSGQVSTGTDGRFGSRPVGTSTGAVRATSRTRRGSKWHGCPSGRPGRMVWVGSRPRGVDRCKPGGYSGSRPFLSVTARRASRP